jgi:hypothetical protein
LVPPDVGRVQGDGHGAEPHVEAADGAAVLVRSQHALAELRVALPGQRCGRRRGEGQPNHRQDVRVQGLGEVFLEQAGGDLRDQPRVAAQGRLHVRGEGAEGVEGQQLALGRVGVALPGLQGAGGGDGPDTIVLQEPEAVLGVVGLPRRAELPEHGRQVAVHVAECDRASVPAAPAADCVQHQ